MINWQLLEELLSRIVFTIDVFYNNPLLNINTETNSLFTLLNRFKNGFMQTNAPL